MNRIAVGMILLAANLGARAAEVGWKMPFSKYAGDRLENSAAVRMDAPPGPSPFFAAGDELWDVKAIQPWDAPLALDWLVWDKTSWRLVAKGNWPEIYELHRRLGRAEFPFVCRMTVDAFETPADGGTPAAGAVPLVSISFVTRSGHASQAKWSGGGSIIEVEAEPTVSENGSNLDSNLKCSVEVPGQAKMNVQSSFTINPGEPLWFARDTDGVHGLDLRVCATLELLDGSPAGGRIAIREGDRLVNVTNYSQNSGPLAAGSGWLCSAAVSTHDFYGYADAPPADPFAEPAPTPPGPGRILSTVTPPESIAKWIRRDLVDARAFVEYHDFKLLDAEFAGYDPLTERLHAYSSDKERIEDIAGFFMAGCNFQPCTVFITLDGVGQSRVLCKSGQKASIERLGHDKHGGHSYEVEPTIGENDELVDVRLAYEQITNDNPESHFNAAVLLVSGVPAEIYSGSANDIERKLRISAEVRRISAK